MPLEVISLDALTNQCGGDKFSVDVLESSENFVGSKVSVEIGEVCKVNGVVVEEVRARESFTIDFGFVILYSKGNRKHFLRGTNPNFSEIMKVVNELTK